MLKVCVAVHPSRLGLGLHRVARMLAKFAPAGVEIVPAIPLADLVVCHVIGWAHWEELRAAIGDRRYAIIQYCLRTTERPAQDWWPVWKRAEAVWSYYDLLRGSPVDFPFYRAPLGIDPAFTPCGCAKPYLVGTSGYVDGMEAIGEWATVAHGAGRKQFHLGPDLHLPGNVTYANGLTDASLALSWGKCQYVSGLRRTEGFELPAYEGLACGARPVMFDREDAWHWLGEHAEYIPEDDQVVASLSQLVTRPYRPVTTDEIAWARETFDWGRIVRGFWDRCVR